jgi:hypothetical protein
MKEDNEYRIVLEHRITSLHTLREDAQERMRQAHRDLSEVDGRLEAVEELYRREFNKEPPVSKAPVERRRTTRIRGSQIGQPSWREAMIATLRAADGPLHAKEIWSRMEQAGFQTGAADPVRSIVSTAVRLDDFERVGPNTFALNGGPHERQPALYDELRQQEGDRG